MSARKVAAAGFSISGLLDAGSRTRAKYPVTEIDVADIADHPANVAYSMDEAGIEKLAESIRADGLTDIPLVRKMADGSWQMLSGHRRKAAYTLLSKDDAAFSRMPCRVVENVTDEQALVLLHTANYFVRELTVTERASATRALGLEVERLRTADPTYTGKRTEDIKADIIAEQTGRRVSGKTIKREEALAKTIENDLADDWKPIANSGGLSAAAVKALAEMDESEQSRLRSSIDVDSMTKSEKTEAILAATHPGDTPSRHLLACRRALRRYSKELSKPVTDADMEALESIAKAVESIRARLDASSDGTRRVPEGLE